MFFSVRTHTLPQPGALGADLALPLRHGGLDAAVRIERRVGRAPAELGGPLGDDELCRARTRRGPSWRGPPRPAGCRSHHLCPSRRHGAGHRGKRGGGTIDAVKDTLRPLLNHQPVEHREIVAMHEGHPVLAIADVNGGVGGAGALGVVSDQALRAAVDEARPDHRGGDHVVGRFERQALVRRAPGERGPSLSCPGEPATHICTG
jgi:hypothetical protein